MNALLALARTEITLYFSNRKALAVTLAAPIFIAAFFGAVLGGAPKKPSKVPVAIVNQDAGAVSKRIVDNLKADGAFEVKEVAEDEGVALVRSGKARAAIVLPEGFGDSAAKGMFRPGGAKPEVRVHFDPSQAVTLSLVKGLLAQHGMQAISAAAMGPEQGGAAIAEARKSLAESGGVDAGWKKDLESLFDSIERVQKRPPEASGGNANALGAGFMTMPFATKEIEVTSGKDKRYNAYAHSFAGMAVQFILFMGIELGMALLLQRRQGLWKRLRAAPLTKGTVLGSRVFSGAVIAVALLAGIYAAALAFFGVRIEGSLAGFALVAVAFAFFTATFGLLIAAIGGTPEATRGLAVVATLLLVMLGGAWVPTFVFPEWLQSMTLAIPTRWAIDGLEGMTWRGLPFEAALAPAGILLAFSAVFAVLAVARFRWEE